MGLGHSASVAAMIATASSSDGAGDITMPDGGGNSFNDTPARVSDHRSETEAVTQRPSSTVQTSRGRPITTVRARRSWNVRR